MHPHTYTLNAQYFLQKMNTTKRKEKKKIFNKDENVFQKSDFTTKIISIMDRFHKKYNLKKSNLPMLEITSNIEN